MGCRHTKANGDLSERNGKKNGRGFNSVPDGDPVRGTDPRLPLNARDVFKLKQSWKGIKRNIEQTGVEMFIRLFKTNQNLKQMFMGFKHLETDDDLRENEALENHAVLVMTTLDDAITNLDSFSYMQEALLKAGESHKRFVGFQPHYFWYIQEPFLEAVRITLGDRYSDNMKRIYRTTFIFILKTLYRGMTDEDLTTEKIQAITREHTSYYNSNPSNSPGVS